jgi:Flp pilus assembly protein TadD
VLLFLSVFSIGCAGARHGVSPALEVQAPDSASQATALDHYLSGSIQEESSEFGQASYEYQLAWLFDPTSREIPLALARVYMHLGEREAARRVLEIALSRHPDDPDLLSDAAELTLKRGDIKAAISLYKRLAKIDSLTPDETLRLILMLEKTGGFKDAIELSKQYLKDYGPDKSIYERIGLLHITRRDFEAADTAFRKLLELDPGNHRVQFLLGGFCVARQRFDEAEGYFKRAVELEPDEPRYWSNLIMTAGEQEKLDTVEVLLDDAVRLFPTSPQFLDDRCGFRQRKGDWDGALEDAVKSSSLDTTRTQPWMAQGFIHHQRKEWDAADEAYRKALALDPESPLVLNNYAYMLAVQNARLDEALKMVNGALEKMPKSASYLDTRAWIYYQMGKYQEALDELNASLALDSKNAEIFEHLGHTFKALGNLERSKEAFKKAAELEPANVEYQELAR